MGKKNFTKSLDVFFACYQPAAHMGTNIDARSNQWQFVSESVFI